MSPLGALPGSAGLSCPLNIRLLQTLTATCPRPTCLVPCHGLVEGGTGSNAGALPLPAPSLHSQCSEKGFLPGPETWPRLASVCVTSTPGSPPPALKSPASFAKFLASLSLAEKHQSDPYPLPASPATLDRLVQLPQTPEKED